MNASMALSIAVSQPKQLKTLANFLQLNFNEGPIELECGTSVWMLHLDGKIETHKMNLSFGQPFNELRVSVCWDGQRFGVHAFRELLLSLAEYADIEEASGVEYSADDRGYVEYRYDGETITQEANINI